MGAKRGLLSEVTLNKAIILFGALFMVIGTRAAIDEAGKHGGRVAAEAA